MAYEIIQKFIKQNRSGKTLNPMGSVLHETATPGASDENEQKYFDGAYRGASAHAFVDCDSITQIIPWNEQAWHAGPTANRTTNGIELCHYDDAEKFQQVWNRAVWLFAWLHVNIIKQTTITTDNLMSHAEVSNKWHETNHQDPVRYFAQFVKTVDDFRAAVQTEINTMIGQPQQTPTPVPQSSVNNDVLKLQQVLNRLKITDGKGNRLAEDGIIGNCTKEATKRQQNICGLTVDGIAGQQTWNSINAILDKPLLKVGSTGITVRYVQYRCGTTYDGIFGNNTKTAVVKFQSSNGLSVDGIVGQNTWLRLIG